MICGLCLKDIESTSNIIEVDGKTCHEECSIEYEKMIQELTKIYEETCPTDIYNMNKK